MNIILRTILTAAALVALSGFAFGDTSTYGSGTTTSGQGTKSDTGSSTDTSRGGATGGSTGESSGTIGSHDYDYQKQQGSGTGGTMGTYSTPTKSKMNKKR